jgi:hypothetical protein
VDGVASRILLQVPTQASQICTLGPPISRATSFSVLPQNEHLSGDFRMIESMFRILPVICG